MQKNAKQQQFEMSCELVMRPNSKLDYTQCIQTKVDSFSSPFNVWCVPDPC